MFALTYKTQNYAWGKKGGDSIVGKIHQKHRELESKAFNIERDPNVKFEDLPFAEFWMGDHPNGPSMVTVDAANSKVIQHGYKEGETLPISDLIKKDPEAFLGKQYCENFTKET